MRSLTGLMVLVLVLGCEAKDDDDGNDWSDDTGDEADADADTDADSDADGGKLGLTFAIDPDLVSGTDVVVEGRFIGEIYNAEEVSFQPDEDAEVLEQINLLLLLGTDGRASGVMLTTRTLDYPEVAVLGFFDLNGTYSSENVTPDSGDVVTMPNNNKFDVVAGETTEVVVNLDLFYPGAR